MWKDIPKWECYYEVNENGDVRNKQTMKLIIGDTNNAGYQRIRLYHKPACETFFRHRLVATLFIPNIMGYSEVNHKDGNKQNNHISNLEWCDRKHNEHEARRIGLKEYKPYGVLYNDGKYVKYEFASELAMVLGVTKRCVMNYLQGKSTGYKAKNIQSIQYLS